MPSEEELEKFSGLETVKWTRIINDCDVSSPWSIDDLLRESDHGHIMTRGDTLVGSVGVSDDLDFWSVMGQGLTRDERLILDLYYTVGLGQREIGSILDLSESRISQMHTSVLKRLRVKLD